MNYLEIPHLKQLARVRNAIELWSLPDVKTDIINFVNSTMWEDLKECYKWTEIENKVSKKVLQLGLPMVLQNDITMLIKPIGLQIVKLLMQLEGNITPCTKYKYWISDLLNSLFWTSEGLIDKRKMAKALTEVKKIDVKDRFALAYSFCCGKELPILWKMLPHDFKAGFTGCQLDLIANDEDRLLVFWTNYCNGKMSKLKKALKRLDFDCSLFSYVFQGALRDGNDVAVKYFWGKLTNEEKEENIVGWTVLALKGNDGVNVEDHFNDCDKYCTDIVCFLISQMNKEQQIEIFKNHSYRLLECLLYDWPWRDFFLLTAQETCIYLSEEEYLTILTRLAKRGEQRLLKILWQKRSSIYKKKFEGNYTLLANVFQLMDIEMIRLILNQETENLRDKIFTSASGLQIFINLMHSDKYELFEILTNECGLVDNDMLIDFKRKLAYHDLDVWFDLISLKKWDFLEKYLYWCLSSDGEIRNFKREFIYFQSAEFVSFLIRFDKWDIVENFLEWCLLTEEEVRNLKRKIFHGEMFCEKLLYELISESKFDTVKKVFDWCMLSEDEMTEFKMERLRGKSGKKLCFELLKENKLEKVDTFLECIMSPDEITIFKRELMISPESFLIFLLITEGIFTGYDIESLFVDTSGSTERKMDMMKRVINWFHPNEEVTVIFREMFQPNFHLLDGYCEVLLNLMDDYVYRQR